MRNHTTEIPRLVTHPREHYLRQNEIRIRHLALPQSSSDPQAKLHLDALLMADDFESIHAAAVRRWENEGNARFAEIHERHRHAAVQFQLYHLDKLAILFI